MGERKLTKEMRDQLRVTSMMFVAHDAGNDAVTSANTTIDLCRDLDAADAEIERLRKENERLKKAFLLLSDFNMRMGLASSVEDIRNLKDEYIAKFHTINED